MQNQNWRLFSRVIAVATLAVLVVSFTTLAVAQRIGGKREAPFSLRRPEYPRVLTVSPLLRLRRRAFNPLTATNRELLGYGLPQAPDKAVDAQGLMRLGEKGNVGVEACTQAKPNNRAGRHNREPKPVAPTM